VVSRPRLLLLLRRPVLLAPRLLDRRDLLEPFGRFARRCLTVMARLLRILLVVARVQKGWEALFLLFFSLIVFSSGGIGSGYSSKVNRSSHYFSSFFLTTSDACFSSHASCLDLVLNSESSS
jgi:hypothetical protein